MIYSRIAGTGSYLPPRIMTNHDFAARLDTNLTVTGPLSPTLRLNVRGDVGLRNLAVSDGQRSVLTVERLNVTGVDAVWPDRVALDRIRIRRSWALIERDQQRRFLLQTLFERPPAAGATEAEPFVVMTDVFFCGSTPICVCEAESTTT